MDDDEYNPSIGEQFSYSEAQILIKNLIKLDSNFNCTTD